MKTVETLKKGLPVANLFIIGGALAFLLTGFVADASSGDEVLAEKETSAEPREVKTWRWEEMYPSDFSELSFLGAVNPDMVDVEKFGVTEQDRKVKLLKENKDKIDFEKAGKVIEILVNGWAEQIQDMFNEMDKAEQGIVLKD